MIFDAHRKKWKGLINFDFIYICHHFCRDLGGIATHLPAHIIDSDYYHRHDFELQYEAIPNSKLAKEQGVKLVLYFLVIERHKLFSTL